MYQVPCFHVLVYYDLAYMMLEQKLGLSFDPFPCLIFNCLSLSF